MLHTKSLALLAAAAAAVVVDATTVKVTNKCGERINFYDNAAVVPMNPGESFSRNLAPGFHGMFRNGVNPQATLAEFTVDGGKLWYDISIIPTGPKSGPDYCPSLQACKDHTGGVGYNTPMQIIVAGCKTRTCLYDGCDDAYQYPKDDTKTTACDQNSPAELIFCPGGSGGQSAPTPPPTTQAPTPPPTTQAPTPPPTTQAPTPPPTTQAPTPPPTTQAPTPPPTTQAPTPVPTTLAPTPEPTTEVPALLRSATDGSAASSMSGSLAATVGSSSTDADTVGSGSVDADADNDLEAGDLTPAPSSEIIGTTIILNPVRSGATSNDDGTVAGESSKDASTQSATESTGGFGSALLIVLGAVGTVAGTAVFVAAKKRKQMEESETKNSLDSAVFCEEGTGNGVLTPIDNIQCI